MGAPGGAKRIAVAGSTGRIGCLVVAAARSAGHEVVELSRSLGVDLRSGNGLGEALTGVDAVIDSTNTALRSADENVDFFTTVTRNLLAAEAEAGVGHHVVLSIVGLSEPARSPHYAGKLAQEAATARGAVPWTVVRATQFHDFAAMVVSWTERDGAAAIAPLLVQPVSPADVASILLETALDAPRYGHIDIAGPETQDLVDMARRTLAARGRTLRLVPTWDGPFGVAMAGKVLLPGPDARIMPTTFDEWLATGARDETGGAPR